MKDTAWHRLLAGVGTTYRAWARWRSAVTPASALAAVRHLTKRKRYCVMVTRALDGGVDARVLQPWRPDEDFTVWLGTSPTSRKIAQLEACDRASLVYEDEETHACAVLVGRARVERGQSAAARRRHFMPLWKAFFPRGPEDGFVAIRFETERIEVIDFSRRITPEPFGLEAACLVRSPSGWVLAPGAAASAGSEPRD